MELTYLVCMLPLILLQSILYMLRRPKPSLLHELGLFAFSLSLILIFTITGVTPMSGLHADIRLDEINLRPLLSISNLLQAAGGCNLLHLLGNVALFLPIGFLLPLLWRRNRLLRTILFGFFLSLLIECIQLFLIRSPDIDDLILNTLGTCIGYLLFFVLHLLLPRLCGWFSDPRGGILIACFYVFFAIASMFGCGLILLYRQGLAPWALSP